MEYNPFSLNGKTVLVTGASSGIGRAISIECSKAGANLVINARNEERLRETENLLSGKRHLQLPGGLSSEESIKKITESMPLLDGVVHSAGVLKRLPLKFINESNLDELMRINFAAPALLTHFLHKKRLLKNEASLVFISSVASSFASLGNIMYMASKGAMNSFMKGVAFELAISGIRANAIQPGMIKTHLTKVIDDEIIKKDTANYPLGRYGTPEEVAYAAIYLLSDTTKWMTGSIITLDGGLTLR